VQRIRNAQKRRFINLHRRNSISPGKRRWRLTQQQSDIRPMSTGSIQIAGVSFYRFLPLEKSARA